MTVCAWCQGERRLEVLEWWHDERAFLLDCCCEAYQAGMIAELSDEELLGDRLWRRGFARWWFEQTGQRARRPFVSAAGTIRVDYGLDLVDVAWSEAREFVLEHHRHCRPPAGWRWGHAVRNGPDLVAVAIVGRPVARRIDHTKVVEVTRLCVDPTLEPALVWNACSLLYAEAARAAKLRGFERIITYTLEGERASALTAVGWEPAARTRGGSWDRPSRRRTSRTPTCAKVRWQRDL